MYVKTVSCCDCLVPMGHEPNCPTCVTKSVKPLQIIYYKYHKYKSMNKNKKNKVATVTSYHFWSPTDQADP